MKENKIKIIMILTIVSILLVFTGITYAYFSAFNNEGSTAEISFGPGKMIIEYADKSDALSLTKTNIQPSDTVLIDKTFTLTGMNTASADGGITMPFTISLEYQNTFQNGELYYFLKRMDENENIVVNIIDMDEMGPLTEEFINNIPFLDDTFIGSHLGAISNWSNETHTQEIANGYFKPNSEKQTVTFNLRMMFPNKSSNQDYNKGATFNGKIVINSTKVPSVTGQIANYLAKLDKEENSLENDNTIDSNLRYTGEDPNNYVAFNYELWRIIGTFNVYNTETNQNEVLTKIIRRNELGSYSWDTTDSNINNGEGINEWSQSKLMTELNTDYLDTSKMDGTTTWYNGSNNTKDGTYYYSNNIKSGSIDKIATVRWNLGGIDIAELKASSNNNTKAISPSFLTYFEENTSKKTYEARLLDNDNYSRLNTYNAERGTNHVINPVDGVERKDYWDGKVGLMYLSDYLYASYYGNWIEIYNSYSWTISPIINSPTEVIKAYGTESSCYSNNVYPVIYLKSDVVITGGSGTKSNPYLLDGEAYNPAA